MRINMRSSSLEGENIQQERIENPTREEKDLEGNGMAGGDGRPGIGSLLEDEIFAHLFSK
jgi:hypothetical protein